MNANCNREREEQGFRTSRILLAPKKMSEISGVIGKDQKILLKPTIIPRSAIKAPSRPIVQPCERERKEIPVEIRKEMARKTISKKKLAGKRRPWIQPLQEDKRPPKKAVVIFMALAPPLFPPSARSLRPLHGLLYTLARSFLPPCHACPHRTGSRGPFAGSVFPTGGKTV